MEQKRNVFIIAAMEDRQYVNQLRTHLRSLDRLITVWDASQIVAGTERQREIDAHLDGAAIILLLVSANLTATEELYVLTKRAVARNAPPHVHVVPVLLHAFEWGYSDYGALAPLPENRRPISRWTDSNTAFVEVVKGIRGIIEQMSDPQGLIAPARSVPDRQGPPAAQRPAASAQRQASHFDVYLCYNSKDRAEVREIARRLQAKGIVPWFDEWELRPGLPWQRALEEQIGGISTVAVFVGAQDLGPWQNMEVEAFLREFVRRRCPVIPTLLETASGEPRLPLFLAGMTWIDFRVADPDPLEQFLWAITGNKPGN